MQLTLLKQGFLNQPPDQYGCPTRGQSHSLEEIQMPQRARRCPAMRRTARRRPLPHIDARSQRPAHPPRKIRPARRVPRAKARATSPALHAPPLRWNSAAVPNGAGQGTGCQTPAGHPPARPPVRNIPRRRPSRCKDTRPAAWNRCGAGPARVFPRHLPRWLPRDITRRASVPPETWRAPAGGW